MSDETPPKVVLLFAPRAATAEGDAPDGVRLRSLKRSRSLAPRCPHPRIEVDSTARLLTCGACGAHLDPLATLADLCDRVEEQERLTLEVDRLQAARTVLREEIRVLQAERRKFRASRRPATTSLAQSRAPGASPEKGAP